MVMVFRPQNNEAAAGNLKRVMQLLGLDAEVREFQVVHGGFALNNKEIVILNRSLLKVMAEFAAYIDVPESDIAEGRVYAANQGGAETDAQFPAPDQGVQWNFEARRCLCCRFLPRPLVLDR